MWSTLKRIINPREAWESLYAIDAVIDLINQTFQLDLTESEWECLRSLGMPRLLVVHTLLHRGTRQTLSSRSHP